MGPTLSTKRNQDAAPPDARFLNCLLAFASNGTCPAPGVPALAWAGLPRPRSLYSGLRMTECELMEMILMFSQTLVTILTDLLVGIRNVTCEGGETQIWTFGQDDRSFETFLPYVGLLGLQLNKKSRF